MSSQDLQRRLFLALTIIASFSLGGCTLTRDLWQADNVNGRKWTTVPLTLEAIDSDDQHSRVHLVVMQDVNMKIKIGEEQFRIRSFRQGDKLVFSLKDPSIKWLLDSAGEFLSKKTSSIHIEVEGKDNAISARVRVKPAPDSGMLLLPYSGARIAKIPYTKHQDLGLVLDAGTQHLDYEFSSYQWSLRVPAGQRANGLHFAGWITKDGQVSTDLQALETLIAQVLATRSWMPLDGMNAIVEGNASPQELQESLPAWTVSLEQFVKVGLLASLGRSIWNESDPRLAPNEEIPSMLAGSQRLTDFGNCNYFGARFVCWAETPTYEFWRTTGRVIATPFTATADAVCWTATVATAPLWGPVYLFLIAEYSPY